MIFSVNLQHGFKRVKHGDTVQKQKFSINIWEECRDSQETSRKLPHQFQRLFIFHLFTYFTQIIYT